MALNKISVSRKCSVQNQSESRIHAKLSGVVARDFSMQELLITHYVKIILRNSHHQTCQSPNSQPRNGPAVRSEYSILVIELTPSTTNPNERGGTDCFKLRVQLVYSENLPHNWLTCMLKEKKGVKLVRSCAFGIYGYSVPLGLYNS